MTKAASIAALVLGFCLFGASAARAEAPQPVPVDQFFKHPASGNASLSPDGKLLAFTASVAGRRRLVVMDIDKRDIKPVAGFNDADVAQFHWVNDKRLVFNIIDLEAELGEQPGSGLYAVDADGEGFRELVPAQRKQARSAALVMVVKWMNYVTSYQDGSDDIVAEGGELSYGQRGDPQKNAFRLNTRTGRITETLTEGTPRNSGDFVFDGKQQLRVVSATSEDGKTVTVLHREQPGAKWQKIGEFDAAKRAFTPLAFDEDGKTLYVSSWRDSDHSAIYVFDFAKQTLGERVLAHGGADLDGGLVFTRRGHRMVGIRAEGMKPEFYWMDAAWARAQATVDKALPGKINQISGDARKRVLVYSSSDTDPGRYFLLDMEKGRLEELIASRPWLKPERMSPTQVISYAARDGLKIPAYLTLPAGRPATQLPLIVLVHGGPYMRDEWGFNPEVQFLASRGYAVLQPEYRGSTGFGWKHFTAGWRTWGLAMQDDLSDGVSYLVKQGTVNPGRVCIMGASYGGYATMMGLAKDPDEYRCGINYVGVTDIGLMFSYNSSDFADSLWARYGMKKQVGDPDTMQAQFAATSPIKQVASIKAPVLLAYGSEDRRVPLIHGQEMRDALKEHGKTYEWMVLSSEGHGFLKEENRYRFYSAVEAFLKKYNPAD
ncbi:MAG: S9 family peptidase [Betaproteobacteria bacterium]|nr:S9 family peptidase [Betaproteobacteria bacterium]